MSPTLSQRIRAFMNPPEETTSPDTLTHDWATENYEEANQHELNGYTFISLPMYNAGVKLSRQVLALQVACSMRWGTDHEDVQIYDPESKKLIAESLVDLTEFGKQNGWFHAGYGGRYNINWSAVKGSLKTASFPLKAE